MQLRRFWDIRKHTRWIAIGVGAALLSACDAGAPPENTWQYAVQGILSGDINQQGTHAVIGSIHHGGSYWDIAKGERLYNWNHKSGEFSTLRAAGLSSDGKIAVTAERGDIVVWDTRSGKSRGFWQAPDQVLSLSLSSNGRYALMGLKNNTATYFDLIQGGGLYTFRHEAEIRAVDVSENNRFAITGSDDFVVKVWDLSSGKPLYRFQHDNQVKTVAISASGRYGFSAAQREDAVIWDLNQGKPLQKLKFHNVNVTTARFSDSEKQLLLGTFLGNVMLFDVKSGKMLRKWKAKPRKAFGGASSKAILSVAFSGNSFYALTSDGMMEQFR